MGQCGEADVPFRPCFSRRTRNRTATERMGSVVTPEHTALPSPRVPSDPRGTRDSSAPTFCPHAAPLCLPAQCELGATSPGVPLTPAQGADSLGRHEVWGRHGPCPRPAPGGREGPVHRLLGRRAFPHTQHRRVPGLRSHPFFAPKEVKALFRSPRYKLRCTLCLAVLTEASNYKIQSFPPKPRRK